MIHSMTLLGWLMRLIIRQFWHCCRLRFLGKCDDQGLGPRGWPFSCLPGLVAAFRKSGDYVLSTCLDLFRWDVVNPSWLPFLQWLYCSLHWWISIGLAIVQCNAVFWSLIQYLSFFSFPERSWIVIAFLCFTVFMSFTSWYALLVCCSAPDCVQSYYIILLSSFLLPFSFTSWCSVYFLVFLRSVRFEFFVSHFSPFIAQIKNLCSDPGFFLLMMFAKDLTGCFSYCCVQGGDHCIMSAQLMFRRSKHTQGYKRASFLTEHHKTVNKSSRIFSLPRASKHTNIKYEMKMKMLFFSSSSSSSPLLFRKRVMEWQLGDGA